MDGGAFCDTVSIMSVAMAMALRLKPLFCGESLMIPYE